MRSDANELAVRNELVVSIVAQLASGDFRGIEELTQGRRLSAANLRGAVEEYGRTLVPLPPEAVSLIDYIRTATPSPPTWSVVVPLFTVEEGRSDLSLELTLSEVERQTYVVEVDNLHVQ